MAKYKGTLRVRAATLKASLETHCGYRYGNLESERLHTRKPCMRVTMVTYKEALGVRVVTYSICTV